jgi:hypothetical protein
MIRGKRFYITRGVENIYTFTIKQNESLLPMVISSGDRFVAKLYRIDTDQLVFTSNLTVADAPRGKVRLVISSSSSNSLVSARGDMEDRYPYKAKYRLVLEATTANNGFFISHIGKVYVK